MRLGELITVELLRSGIRLGTPIILAALGGALCHRAGVLNLALEGKMLLGSFVGILAAFQMGNSYLGVLVAGMAGSLVGLGFALLYLRYRVNLIVMAIAINILFLNLTVFLMRTYLGDVGTWSDPSIRQLPDLAIPLVGDIPWLGRLLSGHNAIVYLAWISAAGLFFLMFRTRFGRHLRAVGENPEAAATVGINVARVQTFALTGAGALCGIGGAFLSLGHLTMFTRNITNNRGWIGLTAALFGRDHPIAVLFTGGFFGMADATAIRLQTTTNIPPSLVQFLPHVVTLLVLIVIALRSRLRDAIASRIFRRRLRTGRHPGGSRPPTVPPVTEPTSG